MRTTAAALFVLLLQACSSSGSSIIDGTSPGSLVMLGVGPLEVPYVMPVMPDTVVPGELQSSLTFEVTNLSHREITVVAISVEQLGDGDIIRLDPARSKFFDRVDSGEDKELEVPVRVRRMGMERSSSPQRYATKIRAVVYLQSDEAYVFRFEVPVVERERF